MASSLFSVIHAAIASLLIIALFVLWVCGLVYARRRGDPARTGFRYLHFVMAFELLALIFSATTDALDIAFEVVNGNFNVNTQLKIHLSEASARVQLTGLLMHFIANALCIVMYVELGNGFTLARKGVREGIETFWRYLAIGMAVVMFVLGVAYFGLANSAYRPLGTFSNMGIVSSADNARLLLGSWQILMFIVAVLLLLQAAIVVHKSRILGRGRRGMHNSSVLYLVSVVLFLVRFLYGVIDAALVLLVNNRYYFGYSFSRRASFLPIIDTIMIDIVFFIALVLVVSMGFRRRGGLASTGGPVRPVKHQWGYLRGHNAVQDLEAVPTAPTGTQQGYQYPEGPPQYYVAARKPEDI